LPWRKRWEKDFIKASIRDSGAILAPSKEDKEDRVDNKVDKEATDKADSEEEAKVSMEVKVAKASMEVKVDKDSTEAKASMEDKEVKVMVEDLLVKAAMAEIQEVTEEEIKEDLAEIRVKAATRTQVMVSLKTTKTLIRAEEANRI
jgi:hypothetical protein